MFRMLCVALPLLSLLVAGCSGGNQASSGTKRVGFVQFTTSTSLDAVRTGFIEGLKEGGFEEGKNLTLTLKNAEGDAGTLDLILKGYVSDNTELVAVAATQALQSAARNVREKPVVFGGVIDPVAAGAAESLDKPKPNITGVYNPFPVGKGLDLVREIMPEVKVVGSLVDPSEPFTEKLLEEAKKESNRLGVRWESVSVSSSNDIASGVQALKARGVQAILQLPSNTMNQGLEGQVRAARNAKLPLFSIQTDQVARGVVAAVGLDLVAAGKQVGTMAARILKGEKPSDIPMEEVKIQPLKVNLDAAKSFGVTLPAAVLDRAEKV